jgi:hypothetical protein
MKFSQLPLNTRFILKGAFDAYGGNGNVVMEKVCLDAAKHPSADNPLHIHGDTHVTPLYFERADNDRILSPIGVTSAPPYKTLCSKKLWAVEIVHIATGDVLETKVYTTKEKAEARAKIPRSDGAINRVVEIKLDEPLPKPVYTKTDGFVLAGSVIVVGILKDGERYMLLPFRAGEEAACLARADEIIKMLERNDRFSNT